MRSVQRAADKTGYTKAREGDKRERERTKREVSYSTTHRKRRDRNNETQTKNLEIGKKKLGIEITIQLATVDLEKMRNFEKFSFRKDSFKVMWS